VAFETKRIAALQSANHINWTCKHALNNATRDLHTQPFGTAYSLKP